MRRLAALIPALCACLLATASPAGAASTWVTDGAGFGHGIGMSQYGARGFAHHGWKYPQILAWYYKGTDLSPALKGSVRVLLESGRGSISVANAKQVGSHALDPRRSYTARAHGAGIVVRDSRGKLAFSSSGPAQFWGASGGVRLGGGALNGVSGGRYHGAIELRPGGGGLLAINLVGLDDYVAGVVPGEMPANWSPEALKAQAVAARTYALATHAGGALFDQYPDTRSQVYQGASGQDPRSDGAVRATAGQVVTYRGRLAATYFFSTSGGQTENVENVFYGSTPQPYLKGVSDPFEGNAPRHRWQFRMSQRQIQGRLGGLCRGTLRAVKVTKRGASPRVVRADVICSRGTTHANGSQLRGALGLYDNWFTITKVSSSATKRPRVLGVLAKLLFPRSITGSFSPAPPGRVVTIESRDGHGRWRPVAVAPTDAAGAYGIGLRRPGVYRVRSGRVAGDPLRVP